MASLVLAEHNGQALDEATAKTVAAAGQISKPVHVLVAGEGCAGAAEQAAKLAGVEKVLVADNVRYGHFLAEPVSELVLSLSEPYEAILAPATANGKNVLPRVAAKLDVPQISEVLSVVSPDVFRRPDLCRQRHPDRRGEGLQESHHRARRCLRGSGKGRKRGD